MTNRPSRARSATGPADNTPPDRRRNGPVTKARLERAAAMLFDTRGFRTTTMKDIAEECGLTPAAFYNHYPSKQDILFSIVMNSYDRLIGSANEAMNAAGDSPIDRLHAAIRAISRWLLENPYEARVSRLELHELDKTTRAQLTDRYRKFRRTIEDVILDGIASGQFRTPGRRPSDMPKVFATAIVSMTESLPEVYPERRSGARETTDEKATELLIWLADRLLSVESSDNQDS
jgi:TetR/AcrR family transcriptional regulator, cholesterol catabolism regulator